MSVPRTNNNGARRRLAKNRARRELRDARLDRGWAPPERGNGRRQEKRAADREYAKKAGAR